ncbi:MAG TPA: M23 family metallopeptidase [Sneathiellales bacterium]|nr:M23 family metallopeptidase [Sneathiellales bacterium]
MLLRVRKIWARGRFEFSQFTDRHFPVRQIMLRSRGTLKYVLLTPRIQLASACAVTVLAVWMIASSAGLLIQNNMIDNRNERLTNVNQAYRSLYGDLSHMQQRFLATTEAIEAKHDQLARMVYEKKSIENRLKADTSKSGPKQSKTVYRSITFQKISQTVSPEFTGIGGRLALVMESHSDLIAQLQERTKSNVNGLEYAIQETGLELSRVLDNSKMAVGLTAMGGPLVRIPEGEIVSRADDGFDRRVQSLASQMSRLSGLESAVQGLPLIPPVSHYYVSSKFGKRRDPATRQWSMHSGLDLAGIRRTPVVSTAPGVVTYARRKGPYGKMIEVDHGQGLKTRYGHLHKILVKKGDKVAFRQQIGQMGSTGRTTGPHVHYEIWVDGKPRNPAKFLKAGQHVFNQ